MANFQPPPTYALPVLVDEKTGQSQFNPIWLNWFIDLVGVVNASGGGAGVVQHNSTGGLQGGTANQFYHLTATQQALVATGFSSTTYTPTLTNVTNLSASTAHSSQWIQLGTTVIVSGQVEADPVGAGSTVLGISLPVASNLANTNECAGTAFCPTVAGQGAAILGDAANNRAQMEWIAVDTANRSMYYIFMYRVI